MDCRNRRMLKSARFIVENEAGEVIAEADTYEEAKNLGGIVIDTEKDSISQARRKFMLKSVKSSKGGEFDAVERAASTQIDKEVLEDVKSFVEEEDADLESTLFNFGTGYVEDGDDERLASIIKFAKAIGKEKDVKNFIEEEADYKFDDGEKDALNQSRFEKDIVKKLMLNSLDENEAARLVASKMKCNSSYAKKLLASWVEEHKPSLLESGILDIATDINKEFDIDGDLDSWADEYMAGSGKSTTLGGEIVRAAQRILYRYYNDGDKIGVGYGNETVNPAARFISEKIEMDSNDDIEKMLNHEIRMSDEEYEEFLDKFKAEVEQVLRENPENFQRANKEDMLDWREPEDKDMSFDKCYVTDDYDNEYWFTNDDDGWHCESIVWNSSTDAEEGDEITEDDNLASEIDKTEEFGYFELDGFIYDYGATDEADEDGEYHSWEITKVRIVDQFCDEGDTVDLEPDSLPFYIHGPFDVNGDEISENDWLANA